MDSAKERCEVSLTVACNFSAFRAGRSRRSTRSADDVQQRLPSFILYDRHGALQCARKGGWIFHAFAIADRRLADRLECGEFFQRNKGRFVASRRQPFRIHGERTALDRPHMPLFMTTKTTGSSWKAEA